MAGYATPVSGQTFLVNQNFEGAGYDNGESWTTGGVTPNPDYTAVSLRGNQSCRVLNGYTYKTFTGQSDAWAFCEFQVAAFPSSEATTGMILDTGSKGVWMSMDSSGHIKMADNSSGSTVYSSSSATTLSVGVHYYAWMHAVNGGTNRLYVNTSAIRPGESDDGVGGAHVVSVANSNATNYSYIYLYGTTADVTYDHVLVSSTSIVSNPT